MYQDLDTLIDSKEVDSSSKINYQSEILIMPLEAKDDWFKIYKYLKKHSMKYLKKPSDEIDFPHVFLVDIDQTLIDTSPMHFFYKCIKRVQEDQGSYVKGSLIDLFISGIQDKLGKDVEFNLETYVEYADARLKEFYNCVCLNISAKSPYVRNELLDPNIPKHLKKISDLGFVILGFTARDPGRLSFGPEQTERELLDVGINFSELNRGKNLMELDFEKIQCDDENRFNYQNYIFYTKFSHKNKYLPVISQMMNRWFIEASEIFSYHADDRLVQLETFPKSYLDSCQTIPVIMERSIRMIHRRIHFTAQIEPLHEDDVNLLLGREDFINDIKSYIDSQKHKEVEAPYLLMSLDNISEIYKPDSDFYLD